MSSKKFWGSDQQVSQTLQIDRPVHYSPMIQGSDQPPYPPDNELITVYGFCTIPSQPDKPNCSCFFSIPKKQTCGDCLMRGFFSWDEGLEGLSMFLRREMDFSNWSGGLAVLDTVSDQEIPPSPSTSWLVPPTPPLNPWNAGYHNPSLAGLRHSMPNGISAGDLDG